MNASFTQEQTDILQSVEDLLGRQLVVHNDNVNTFDWVIESLVEICRHTWEQAEQCALIVHHKGKCAVKSGAYIEMAICKAILSSADLTVKLE